jgi:RimJ/RimL family protein N-acetyltransferase
MVGPWFPGEWPEPEITYFLLEECGGKGYATEAVRASLDWVFANGWTTAMSAVADGNIPSLKIVERFGAVAEGMVTIPPNREMQIYRYPTPETLQNGAAE